MSVKHSGEEYPEHLNPFHKRKNSFKESIRGLRNTIARSFRGDDKKRPEIRKRQDVAASVQPSRHTLSVIPRTQTHEVPIPLPRSRFSERVPKEKTAPSQTDQTTEQNPFEEPVEIETKTEATQPEIITPIPTERKRVKRRKKKAPIPPTANGDVASSSMNGSKWSLLSTDTEFSSTCPSDYEPDYVPHEIQICKPEEILQITEKIQKLTDQTDINPKSNEVPEETNSPPDTKETPSEIVKDEEEAEIHVETNLKINGIDDDNKSTDLHLTDRVDDLPVKLTDDPTKIIVDDQNNNTEINVLHDTKCDIQMIDDDDDEERTEDLTYSESQSIVFAYTKDETNEEKFVYREKRSISLSGSKDELQNLDDSIVGRRIEQFENSSPTAKEPSTPKGRRSIPSKENMLG